MTVEKNPQPQGVMRWVKRPLWMVVLLGLTLTGCAGAPSILQPASENAGTIANLIWVILGIATFVFVVVEALLIYAIVRYRRRPNSELPKQIEGNVPLEIGWTAFPAIVLAIVFALTLGTLTRLDTPPAVQAGAGSTQAVHVVVIGHQWWWEFQYPDLGITTANELHVPVGTTLFLDLELGDVIHSFWVPELGSKMDAIPGRVNHTWYKLTKTGDYYGQCAEFCGVEHAMMHIKVVVETPDQYQAWVKDQQQPVPTLSGAAAQGEKEFLSMPCQACHTINGTKAQGKVGPNLTHFASRSTFAGASFDNTPQNVQQWLHNPQQMKPGNQMPNLGLTNDQVNNLVQFLESLK